MRRTILGILVLGAAGLIGVIAWRGLLAQPGGREVVAPAKPQAAVVPITNVVLFSSGVGYFQREGEVTGDTRVDLTFPVTDINDLLKSLVVQDLNGGTVSAVNYDSHDPVEKTLRSFALNLTSNPSLGELLNQARGEKVEIVLLPTSPSQAGTYSGVIIGIETQRQPAGKDAFVTTELLNILGADGVRSLPLNQVQRVRFLNPVVESELRRALEVLAQGHDTQKKAVSLQFTGEGRRQVRVGYVVENPIWKTSYRLVLPASGVVAQASAPRAKVPLAKPFLQGWAVVENTGDDDWNNVRMVLVSGRPISFQMDLYAPLYVPRPTVEPELFASLRPQSYSGDMSKDNVIVGLTPKGTFTNDLDIPVKDPLTGLVTKMRADPVNEPGSRVVAGFTLERLAPGQGQAVRGFYGNNSSLPSGYAGFPGEEALKEHRKRLAAQRAKLDLRQGVSSLATGEQVGHSFQYLIDHPVTLPRQKSALLPIVNQNVEGTRVSIFNESVHPKFPLHGLKFKNTTGGHLMQGPLTVFEGNSYAGDARIPDLQPNEERLLSFAVDLGMEVKAEGKSAPDEMTAVKIVKGIVHRSYKQRRTREYLIANRSEQERLLVLEHPFDADWKLVAPEKPTERSRDVYRFEITVPAGKTLKQEIAEEVTPVTQTILDSLDESAVKLMLTSTVTSPKLKESLERAIGRKTKIADMQRQLADAEAQLKSITEDQARIRANLKELPPTAAAYQRYLEKFDKQESEIEQLQDSAKQLRLKVAQQQKEFETFVAGLNVE